NINLANMFALVGAVFFVATLLTQTMVPLRVANMVGCTFFVGFGALAGNVATFLLYLLLLPINAFRLRQMLNLVKKARSATQGDTSMEWLKPFMTERKYRKGDVLFRKGDKADEMLLTVTGKFLVTEIAARLLPRQRQDVHCIRHEIPSFHLTADFPVLASKPCRGGRFNHNHRRRNHERRVISRLADRARQLGRCRRRRRLYRWPARRQYRH